MRGRSVALLVPFRGALLPEVLSPRTRRHSQLRQGGPIARTHSALSGKAPLKAPLEQEQLGHLRIPCGIPAAADPIAGLVSTGACNFLLADPTRSRRSIFPQTLTLLTQHEFTRNMPSLLRNLCFVTCLVTSPFTFHIVGTSKNASPAAHVQIAYGLPTLQIHTVTNLWPSHVHSCAPLGSVDQTALNAQRPSPNLKVASERIESACASCPRSRSQHQLTGRVGPRVGLVFEKAILKFNVYESPVSPLLAPAYLQLPRGSQEPYRNEQGQGPADWYF